MKTENYGWCGKLLKIDLSNSQITVLQTMDYADRFLGGRGIATRLYWELVKPEIKAFDPEIPLIFMTGPLGATGVQGGSRFIVAGKSPMLLPETGRQKAKTMERLGLSDVLPDLKQINGIS